jgi:hypothetical protein
MIEVQWAGATVSEELSGPDARSALNAATGRAAAATGTAATGATASTATPAAGPAGATRALTLQQLSEKSRELLLIRLTRRGEPAKPSDTAGLVQSIDAADRHVGRPPLLLELRIPGLETRQPRRDMDGT